MSDEKPLPIIAHYRHVLVDLKPGKTYRWCACGRSEDQPWCDGSSHRGTGFKPIEFSVEEARRAQLCQCKHSGTAPFCDGTHGKLQA